MSSSSSTPEFKDIKRKIKRALWEQKKDDKETLLELHKTFHEFLTGRSTRKEVMKNIADLGNTTTGMAGVLFLQHLAKQDVKLMQMLTDLYTEVEETMVTKMEYIVKAD
jgi:hypothetical protein